MIDDYLNTYLVLPSWSILILPPPTSITERTCTMKAIPAHLLFYVLEPSTMTAKLREQC